MGTWDVGPFDNDTAADFCASLDEAADADRPGLVRDALVRVLDADDPLDQHLAVEAVAAAALVTAQCPGGRPVTSAYGPDLPVPALPADLRAIAARALDRVQAEPSELRGLWAETDRYPYWLHGLQLLRRVLTFPAPQPVARSWARIDTWMQRHAPACHALLAGRWCRRPPRSLALDVRTAGRSTARGCAHDSPRARACTRARGRRGGDARGRRGGDAHGCGCGRAGEDGHEGRSAGVGRRWR
ncbi:DUF4259 domain-containing protein [Streptomyces sp. NPDC054952]